MKISRRKLNSQKNTLIVDGNPLIKEMVSLESKLLSGEELSEEERRRLIELKDKTWD